MQYRKKPVVIEAWQYVAVGDKTSSYPTWIFTAYRDGKLVEEMINGNTYISVHTSEGVMRAAYGDWIIKGIKNELYPCKPDIFAATYEAVEPEVMEKVPSPVRDHNREVFITYCNHKGDVGYRTIIPYNLFYGTSLWHSNPQWLVNAYDVNKGADRTFAMKSIQVWCNKSV